MPSRRDFLAMAPVAAMGAVALVPAVARAQSGSAPGGAQAINSSVFRGEHIKSVTAVSLAARSHWPRTPPR